METGLLTVILILSGLSLGWVMHRRSLHRMMPFLKRLAAEKSGTVQSKSLFLMPKLFFSHSGASVEVSSASTGIDGQSTRYTYATFSGLDSKNFEFRIVPRSLQTIGDQWIGLKKPVSTKAGNIEKHLAIYTNDPSLMEAVLSDRIQGDLLCWAENKRNNRIDDIRNYDNKLIYAVTGELNNYVEYKLLIDTACRFYDAVIKALSGQAG